MRLLLPLTLCLALPAFADDASRLIRLDHYLPIRSSVPAIAGQTSAIYIREVVLPATALRSASLENRVVLFVHGAGTPAEVAFDPSYQDYSWMAYLARAGFDVFAMDMTGYGRSTRPPAMHDACNLSPEQHSPCPASYAQQMTTLSSDWNDISGVVDHLLALRHVQRLDLIGWSLGGPRAGGYAAQHPGKVRKLVLLSPAYNRTAVASAPAQVPAAGPAFNTQSRDEFYANWNRQLGCPNQYDQEAAESVWSAMLESDPVGATWGTGVRRAPNVTTWGWNPAMVAKLNIPVLLIAGAYDKQVLPQKVRELYDDLPSKQKVMVDLACSSHNALWERNHLLLFQASLDFLTKGTVNGMEQGLTRLGY